MPALNFKAQFAPLVESGEKCQTIRAYRKDKRDPRVGDTLYLYTGMRTKQCRNLGTVRCSSVTQFKILHGFDQWVAMKQIGNVLKRFCGESADTLAIDDGFEDFAEMCTWFDKTHGLPFEGLLIRWLQVHVPRPARVRRRHRRGESQDPLEQRPWLLALPAEHRASPPLEPQVRTEAIRHTNGSALPPRAA